MLHFKQYLHESSSEWVTFVHGAGGTSSIWFRQIRKFKKEFNLLLIDLRGHGMSKNKTNSNVIRKYTFEFVTNDIIEVLDHLKIRQSHFVGISLGTIIIRKLAELRPDLVKSMIMGGAILKLNFRSQILIKFGVIFKSVLPYMLLYKFFAFVVLPRKKHSESRNMFINEAKKLYQKEFIKWFRLGSTVNPILKLYRSIDIGIPTLYVMGDEDYMFLKPVEYIIQKHKSAELSILPQCGHVVNIERPDLFNSVVIGYISKLGIIERTKI